MSWSAQDELNLRHLEHSLAELKERRASAHEAVKRSVVGLVQTVGFRNGSVDFISGVLIDNAEAIRDALAPFDSGVRVSEVSTTE